MTDIVQQKVSKWLTGNFDEATKETIKKLQATNPDELTEAFYQNLEFGTGGLRGIMGIGTNRMNKYTVGMATQGFANYLKQKLQGEIKVAIAHDCRNNSRFFAETTAHVFAANGIKVFLFESLRPTPELSFTIRHLKCQAGVVCTASHNPKEYNGYKAYWSDGGQLVPPHDKAVVEEVEKISSVDEVKFSGLDENITLIGKEVDEAFWNMSKGLSINPDIIAKQKDLNIVYTPIHGSGITLTPELLKRYGFTNVHIVEEQATPDGNFPTVVYPNPEESEAMSIGLKKARALNADILLGTDPDADRVGVGIKNDKGEWVLLNGNQIATVLFCYIIEAKKEKGLLRNNDFMATTIVTTDLLPQIARQNDLKCYLVLTGFKWIAEQIRILEGKEKFLCGGEESYGYMIGDQVRDKDAVSSVALICEAAAYLKNKGIGVYDYLLNTYVKYGLYKEHLVSLTKKGMRGQEEIAEMMKAFRANPPKSINGSEVVQLLDYEERKGKNLKTGESWNIELPKSNVLQFITADGSKISARPSGTEPKIKFYFSVNSKLASAADFEKTNATLDAKIKAIIEDLKLQ
jgi:phosphoglucomutase